MSSPSYPIVPGPVKRSWIDEHPYGKMFLGALLIVVVFVGGLFWLIEYSFRNSDVYLLAMRRAQSNSKVIEQLGQPIHARWFVTGNISTTGPTGYANMTIPLVGSRQEGRLHLVARKKANLWSFSELLMETRSSSEPIDLLQDSTHMFRFGTSDYARPTALATTVE